MTITWAGIERILDELIAWYQHACTDLSKVHPIGLDNKIKYLKLMQRDGRFTDETAKFIQKIRIEAKRLGSERHEIIHGMLWHTGGLAQEWTSQRVVYKGPFARLTNRKFDDAELRKISSEMADFLHFLAPKVWVLTGKDHDKYPACEVEHALREFGH